MQNHPLISIVINNYNYCKYLRQCIESALGQDYEHKEIIVVDDGSSDESEAIIRSYESKVVSIFQPNKGQGSAFNAGFKKAKGDFILFLDSDDYLVKNALSRAVCFIQPSMSRLQFDLHLVDQAGISNGQSYVQHYCKGVMLSGDLRQLIFQNQLMALPTSGNLFPRSILDRILPMPENEWKICSDAYLIWLSAFYGPVISMSEALGCYRLHSQSQWASLEEGSLSTIIKQLDLHLKLCKLLVEHFPAFNDQLVQLKSLTRYDLHLCKAKIISLLLEQDRSLISETSFQLLRSGLKTVWLHPSQNWIGKWRSTTWFFLMSLLPSSLARPLAIKFKLRLPFQPQVKVVMPFN